jgi:hypothetical protein
MFQSDWDPTVSRAPDISSQGVEMDEFDYSTEERSVTPLSSADAVTNEPVVMARMQLLLDTTLTRKRKGDNEYGTSSSPVHALSQLSMWSARIGFLHSDRQRLVQGIQAANARINMISREWQDHDGIGSLFSEQNEAANDPTSNVRGFNPDAEFQSKIDTILAMTADAADQETSTILFGPIMSPKTLSPSASRLFELDNFGLGSTATAYSDIHSMVRVLIDLFQPYYSPERTQTEEFQYCLFSWVALQSVMEYQQDATAALAATNTLDRIEAVYHIMMAHTEDLRELALAKSEELRDCGEECELL